MMAGRRSLSATTKRASLSTKQLAVAAGSFVAVSASASAFWMDTTNAHKANPRLGASNGWRSRLPFSDDTNPGVLFFPPFRSWMAAPGMGVSAQRVGTKLGATRNRHDDDDERNPVRVASTAEGMEQVHATLRTRFRVGDSYVWKYQDAEGTPTCWEKYTVTDIEEIPPPPTREEEQEQEQEQEQRQGHSCPWFVVTIELSTKFEEEHAYHTHHRIKANLMNHVLESFESRRGWRIHFEYFVESSNSESESNDGSSWKTFGKGDNVQAFEEKFDVFSMVSAAAATAEAPAAATIEAVSKATKESCGNGNRNRNGDSDSDSMEDPRDECLVPWTVSPSPLLSTTHCDDAETPSSSSCYSSTRPASLAIHTDQSSSSNDSHEPPSACTTTNLTQTKRHGYTEAWYGPVNHETLSGIALYKEFPHSQHSFSLIERTTTATTCTRTENGAQVLVTDAIQVIV